MRTRPARRLAALAALTAGLLAPASCELFRSVGTPEPTPPQRQDVVPRAAEPTTPTPPTVTAAPPGKHATRRGPYVFYHDFELDSAEPLFAELEALPDLVYGELRLPPGNGIIQVFLFDTQDRYERYMRGRYRHLPTRRAYFIAEPRIGGGTDDLKVFTWMGDHLRTDLRHELTHALLHSVLKDVPLWLDEGLAGFFELPPANDGVNPQHLEMLRRGPFQPDLGRLERLDQVRQMEKPEYREAWAWVHLMLRSSPEAKAVLCEYLQTLRTNPLPGPLLPRLREVLPDPEQALADHLGRIEYPRPRPRPR
ncbi:MAG TPA: hypothetical protein VKE74_25165 [Gemmataceae bacterium]|nr:hypothetical protein [Gemmataceae bacterium]